MTQYCRYCEHVDCHRGYYTCRETGETMYRSTMKHTNKCKHFQLNPVDALRENVKGYRPTGRKIVQFGGLGEQVTLEEVMG